MLNQFFKTKLTPPPPPRSSNYERLRLLNLNFFNKKGFSLVGILVASTIGTILVLGLASSQVILAKWQRKISTKNKVSWLETRMQSVINSPLVRTASECLPVLEDQIKDYDFSAPSFCLAKQSAIPANIQTCGALNQATCATNALCHWNAASAADDGKTYIRAFKKANPQSFTRGKEVAEVKVNLVQCCFSGICGEACASADEGNEKDFKIQSVNSNSLTVAFKKCVSGTWTDDSKDWAVAAPTGCSSDSGLSYDVNSVRDDGDPAWSTSTVFNSGCGEYRQPRVKCSSSGAWVKTSYKIVLTSPCWGRSCYRYYYSPNRSYVHPNYSGRGGFRRHGERWSVNSNNGRGGRNCTTYKYRCDDGVFVHLSVTINSSSVCSM